MHKNAGKTILLSMMTFLVILVTGCPNPVNATTAQNVAAAKEALAVGYSDGDTAASVTANVSLASSGEKEVTITWTSDNGAVSTTGIVTRPKAGEADITVTLTATLTKNTVSDTKTFTLTVKAIPDTTPPAEVTDLKRTAGDTKAELSWTIPADTDFAGVKISADGIDETTITKEKTTSSITGLTNGKEYTFTVKTYDTAGNSSTGTTVKVTPLAPDTTPPANVTGLTAAAGDTEVTLSWTNPTDADFDGVKISAEGITEITVTKENTSKIITGLSNGTSYTFTVKTYDMTGNTSTGTTLTVTPAQSLDKNGDGFIRLGTSKTDPNGEIFPLVAGRRTEGVSIVTGQGEVFENTLTYDFNQFEAGKKYYIEGAAGVDAVEIYNYNGGLRGLPDDFNITSKGVAVKTASTSPTASYKVHIEVPTKDVGGGILVADAPFRNVPAVQVNTGATVTGTRGTRVRIGATESRIGM